MRTLLRNLGLAVALCFAATVPAQYALPPGALENIPVELMPAQDNDRLLAEEKALQEKGRPQRFAVPIPVKIAPETNGSWTTENGFDVWRTRISSPGAKTLNLGFSEYNLPAGAELFLHSPEERYGPFTAMDNEDHNQFWTPMLAGDELIVELRVPAGARQQVQLRLSFVNHDFADFRKSFSGSCNIDVVCGAANGLGIIDGYRDIIRSVAVYSLGGRLACTGFLVNNANNDGTPFFMTAAHCQVSATNAPTLVAYWNFENATCRTPDSNASGGPGNGSRTTFNSGSELLARSVDSDVILTKLDDPVVLAANAFFAGWSAEAEVPTDTMIAVHHPNLDEKRISFSFQDPFRAPYLGNAPVPDGNHLTIPDWDLGTTERGSSGSPIFDRFKRVRGQLHGGGAACGNDRLDSYGYFHSSWEGGGTPETRLKDWLDPCGTGTLTVDGFEQSDIPNILVAETNCATGCNNETRELTFRLGDNFPAGTSLSIASFTAGINPSLSTNSASGGETVTLTIPGNQDLPSQAYQVVVSAAGGGLTDDITFTANLVDDLPEAPALAAPTDGAVDVALIEDFTWSPVFGATSYDLELSTTSDFSIIIERLEGVTGTTTRFVNALIGNTTYFWRVRTNNDCGNGEWTVASFTSVDLSCAAYNGNDLPATINEETRNDVDVTFDIADEFDISTLEVFLDVEHEYVGDLEGFVIAPDGTQAQLFGRAIGGFCNLDDLYLAFTEAATLTAEDYADACQNGDPNNRLAYRPLESFAVFEGSPVTGTWTLRIRDRANGDGGAITRADLSFCTSGGTIPDFSVSSATQSLEVCDDNLSTIALNLGADYAADVSLEVAADGQMLDNFNFNYAPSDRVMTVNFTSWALLGPGDYTLGFTLTNPDGTVRTLSLPLRVGTAATAATLNSPEDNGRFIDGEVTFNWSASAGVTDYLFEYSTNADFSVITFSQVVSGNLLTLTNLPLNDVIYWRVTARNDCGGTVSDRRQFSLYPVGVHDFGAGRQLAVYPNPVRDLLTVDASGAWPTGYQAVLFDAAGRKIADYSARGAGRSQWSLAELPTGVYYLRFVAGGEQRTERLVRVK